MTRMTRKRDRVELKVLNGRIYCFMWYYMIDNTYTNNSKEILFQNSYSMGSSAPWGIDKKTQKV